MDPADRLKNFEARLGALKQKMEAGLADRAQELRAAARRLLDGDEQARQEIKRLSHKLRGIAGTYGHSELTEMAANAEQRASLSPRPAVAELAEALAGEADRINADSAAAEVAQSEAPRQPAPKRVPRPAGKVPLRILGMDDDPNTLKLLRLTLQQVGGFNATMASSATEALEILQRQEFDLVVSDAMMPDMNGLEFCEAARKLGGRAGATPVVILSAATPDELGWEGHPFVRGWLRKPFRPAQLVADIEALVTKLS